MNECLLPRRKRPLSTIIAMSPWGQQQKSNVTQSATDPMMFARHVEEPSTASSADSSQIKSPELELEARVFLAIEIPWFLIKFDPR